MHLRKLKRLRRYVEVSSAAGSEETRQMLLQRIDEVGSNWRSQEMVAESPSESGPQPDGRRGLGQRIPQTQILDADQPTLVPPQLDHHPGQPVTGPADTESRRTGPRSRTTPTCLK